MNPVLSPKELAMAIGVSESSLKRWADDGRIRVSRTAGGHRRIPIAEAIRFIRETRAPVVRPEILGLPDLSTVARERPTGDTPAEQLHSYLVQGRAHEARGLILSLYLEGENIAGIVDGPIRDALARVGHLWLEQEDGIFYEHRATEICMEGLLQLQSTLNQPPEGAPVAVGGAPPHDTAVLASLAAAIVLTGEGFRAVNLGPQTPYETLEQAAGHHHAALVWLTVGHPVDRQELQRGVVRLAESLQARGAKLIVGGDKLVNTLPSLHQNIYVGESMAALAAFARGLKAAQASASGGTPVG